MYRIEVVTVNEEVIKTLKVCHFWEEVIDTLPQFIKDYSASNCGVFSDYIENGVLIVDFGSWSRFIRLSCDERNLTVEDVIKLFAM